MEINKHPLKEQMVPSTDWPKQMFAQIDSCWVCRSPRLIPISKTHFAIGLIGEEDPELGTYSGHSIRLNACAGCTFIQPEALPTLPRFFDRLYDQKWGESWMASEFEAHYKDFIFKGILDRLEERVSVASRTILDIGAHVGRFIYLAAERGWSAEGIELNPLTAAFARRKTGLLVHQKNAHELAAERITFSAVTMTDTLEHIPFPMQILEQVGMILKPGGWISIKVPFGRNQLLKEKIRSYIKPNYRADIALNLVHVNHFSVQSLRTALRKAGYDDITVTVGAPELFDCHSRAWLGKNGCLKTSLTNLFHLMVYDTAKVVPFGLRSPLALNLQAFARKH